ncbi:MAG: putative phage tail assembly chaperone [Methylomonas sp.]
MSTAQTGESTENNDLITVTIGGNDLRFDVSTANFNQYLNEQTPQNKISPAYNFLQRTVVKEDKDSFKQAVMRNKVPNGVVVMQIAGVIAQEFGADVEITVKK